jgi:hypothetical protein
MPKMSNKWTTIAGIIILAGTGIACIGQMMGGDFNAIDCMKESWLGIGAGIVALKAADGGL